jgi:hypothetical protein
LLQGPAPRQNRLHSQARPVYPRSLVWGNETCSGGGSP